MPGQRPTSKDFGQRASLPDHPSSVTREDLIRLVEDIQIALYWEPGMGWNAAKEINDNVVEELDYTMGQYGLAPSDYDME